MGTPTGGAADHGISGAVPTACGGGRHHLAGCPALWDAAVPVHRVGKNPAAPLDHGRRDQPGAVAGVADEPPGCPSSGTASLGVCGGAGAVRAGRQAMDGYRRYDVYLFGKFTNRVRSQGVGSAGIVPGSEGIVPSIGRGAGRPRSQEGVNLLPREGAEMGGKGAIERMAIPHILIQLFAASGQLKTSRNPPLSAGSAGIVPSTTRQCGRDNLSA